MKQNECPVSNRCGGCSFTGISYASQLQKKHKAVIKLLGNYGKVEPPLGMKHPEHYRCKVHHVFSRDRKGIIHCGTYAASSHYVVDTPDCILEDAQCQAIIATIRKLVDVFHIRVFDEDRGFGTLRHVLLRKGYATGEIMVVLVMADTQFPRKNDFIKALLESHPQITTIVSNLNREQTTMVLGSSNKTLYGPGFIYDELCGLRFRISPNSFYQVNPPQAEVIYRKAIELAELTGNETVIDAYCGTGTIGLSAAGHCKKVIGIELNKDAVRDAKLNAKKNRITNAEFYQGDAGKYMDEMAKEGLKANVVFMDPPRSGSTKLFLDSIVTLAPDKVVYISCGPESLARDLKYITEKGYVVKDIHPVDMFPYTEHVETCVLLCHQKATKYATFDYTPDGSYMDELNKHASYREINEYIEAKYGYKVHSAYIAQVKRECGIEMSENYNLSQCEDYEPKLVTEEKRKAIKEALKHFNMID